MGEDDVEAGLQAVLLLLDTPLEGADPADQCQAPVHGQLNLVLLHLLGLEALAVPQGPDSVQQLRKLPARVRV